MEQTPKQSDADVVEYLLTMYSVNPLKAIKQSKEKDALFKKSAKAGCGVLNDPLPRLLMLEAFASLRLSVKLS